MKKLAYIKGLILATALLGLEALAGLSPLHAQVITLAEAYKRMMAGEIEFQVLNLERDIAKELAEQARGELRPRIGLNFKVNHIDQNIISSDNKQYDEGQSSYGTRSVALTLTQPLYDPVAWRNLDVSQAQTKLTHAKAEEARNQLVGEMVDAFLDVAHAQFALQRAKHVVGARRDFVEMLNAQVEAGRADLSAVLRAEGEILSAEGDVSSAEMQLTEALFGFARYAGGDVSGVSLSNNNFGYVGSAALRKALTRNSLLQMNPQMQIALAEVDIAKKVLHRTAGGYLPKANVEAEVGIDDTDGSLFGGGSRVRTNKIGLSVDVPFYQGGQQASRMREQKLRLQIAERRLELTRRMVLRQYDALIAAERRAAERAGVLSRQANAANEALVTVRAEQGAGRVGADSVLERKLNADVIALERQAARLQQLRLQMQLYRLFGALDVEALSRQLNG